MSSSTPSRRKTTDYLTFIIKDSDGNIAHRIRYSNLNLTRHSGLLRSHIFNHGLITFDLTDLHEHKYPLHDPEAFAQVIHWLAENCKPEPLSYARKQLQWDESQRSLVWRGWRKADAFGKPKFERRVPWAPLECHLKIGAEHAVGFDKALWLYMYMLQLKLDGLLEPVMLELRAGLFEWLEGNVPKAYQVETLWLRFGKGKRDGELSTAGIRRFVGAMEAGGLSDGDYEGREMCLNDMSVELGLERSLRLGRDSGLN